MTNSAILRIAMEQSAVDAGCTPEDFLSGETRFFRSRPNEKARRYLKLPLFCDIVSYGTGIVVSCAAEAEEGARTYLAEEGFPYCFETPSLHKLTAAFAPFHARPFYMAEYFLPDTEHLPVLSCPLPTRILTEKDFGPLYVPEWSNALCANRRHLDRIGIGAYDGNTLVGFAACSADCDTMWQIGIDVLPAYRRLGIAGSLVNQLTLEILERGIVPFYCAAWSNIPSVRTAIRAGYMPSWVHLTCVQDDC